MSRHKITYVGTTSKNLIPISYETLPSIPAEMIYRINYIIKKSFKHGSTVTNSEYLKNVYTDRRNAQKVIHNLFKDAIEKYADSFSSSFSAMIDETCAKVHVTNSEYELYITWKIVGNLVIGGTDK